MRRERRTKRAHTFGTSLLVRAGHHFVGRSASLTPSILSCEAGWKARTEIVEYCVDVVDSGMERKRAAFEKEDTSDDEQARRRRQDAMLYAEEVKVRSLRSVELVRMNPSFPSATTFTTN